MLFTAAAWRPYAGSTAADDPEAYLARAWTRYKRGYIHPDGYVHDPVRDGGEVTSEGQSYALLRAVWSGDQATFARVWRWTDENLRRADGLLSWRWRPGDGIIDPNTATDAEQDIAFALILAADRFGEPAYRDAALDLLRSVRSHSALRAGGGWFPAAGNWAVESRVINLSYFCPYAYPYFHRLDPEGAWMDALDLGYVLLDELQAAGSLAPDFAVLDASGSLAPIDASWGLSGDYSFDAMRIHWRVALDCLLHDRERACADATGAGVLAELYRERGGLATRYSIAGEPLTDAESWSFYGALLPALELHAPDVADAIRRDKLTPRQLRRLLRGHERYYDANWVWFGLAARGLIIRQTPAPEVVLGNP